MDLHSWPLRGPVRRRFLFWRWSTSLLTGNSPDGHLRRVGRRLAWRGLHHIRDYRSSDGGKTWSQVFSGARGAAVFFDPTNGDNAYAALGDTYGSPLDGIYKSTDAGQTWSLDDGTGTNVLPSNLGTIKLATAPSNPTTLYAGLFSLNFPSNQFLGLFKTTDGGTNWMQLPALPEPPQVIRVDPVNAGTVFFGGHGNLYRSIDGGQTWTTLISTGDYRTPAFSVDGSTLYIGDDGGAFSTADPLATPLVLSDLNATLAITQFYPGMSIHPTNADAGFAGSQDLGVDRFNDTVMWDQSRPCDGGWTAIDFLVPSVAYADCTSIPNSMQLFKSTSNGDPGSWSSALNGIDVSDRVLFFPPLVMDPF